MTQETTKVFKATTDIEFNIQCLEEWAKSCSDNRDLKDILIVKINQLHNRLKRLGQQMDTCVHCGSIKDSFGNRDNICLKCNGFDGNEHSI
jgi:hypothetical protein